MPRIRRMIRPLLAALLLAALAAVPPASPGSQMAPTAPFRLTIDNIMRGDELIGTSPSDVQWSFDGRILYFRWKKPGAKAAELYAWAKSDPAPHSITAEEMMKRPPAASIRSGRGFGGFGGPGGGAQAIFDKAKRRALLIENGDVKLRDLKTGNIRTLLATDEREAGVRFSFDEKKIVYTAADNIFVMALDGGELRQMTSFTKRAAPAGPAGPAGSGRTTDADKWYQDQQSGLFQALKRGGGEGRPMPMGAPRGQGQGPASRRRAFVLAENQSVAGLDLSPDESQAVFTVSEPAADIRSTIVPNYVTKSGYTEDIASRPKAAYASTRSSRM
ncbi:MAG: hypothetical protein PHI34_04565, partial [Acidobacteriota bacterium]|nr:hypothetical protein [Acidobacteriota bacterium]